MVQALKRILLSSTLLSIEKNVIPQGFGFFYLINAIVIVHMWKWWECTVISLWLAGPKPWTQPQIMQLRQDNHFAAHKWSFKLLSGWGPEYSLVPWWTVTLLNHNFLFFFLERLTIGHSVKWTLEVRLLSHTIYPRKRAIKINTHPEPNGDMAASLRKMRGLHPLF